MSTQLLQGLCGLLPVGEKKKLLNTFLHNVQESEVKKILKDCQGLPSIQYNNLKLLLANKFQLSDLIIELLRHGERSIIQKAVCLKWIYAGQLSNSEFLLNQLFPTVSFNCRRKIINRIGRFIQNEEKADEIWNAVEQRYGFIVALPLLQACTKEKIISVISKRKIKLIDYQVLEILKKYPDAGLQYLRNHYTHVVSTCYYRKPLLYVLKNHSDEFLDLFLNHWDKIQRFTFGKRRSTYMIRTYRAKLLQQPRKFSSILQSDQIRRKFSAEEFQIFFESTLNENPDCVDWSPIWNWLKTVPVEKRLNMIRTAFLKLYHIDIDEHPKYMDPKYITLLPDEKRLSVIQWKIDNEKSYGWIFNELYLYFYREEEMKFAWIPLKPCNLSVPELQKLLFIEQDGNTRATLCSSMIGTCYINQDLPQLLYVLTLLSKRSRNDQEVRYEIFKTIRTIMKGMEFTKKHWDVIVEMIQVSLVFEDTRGYTYSETENILETCLAFHITSKLPLNNLVNMLIKVKIHNGSTTWINSAIVNPADKRILLEAFVKELENLQSSGLDTSESTTLAERIANLIQEICDFNNRQVKVSNGLEPILIASHPWLRNKLEEMAKEEEKKVNENNSVRSRYSWNFAKKLFKIIQVLRNEQKLCVDAFTSSEDLFAKILQSSPSQAIFMHFISKNPSELTQNWSSILSKMLKSETDLHFIGKLKSSNYSTLIVQSIKICSEIINQKVEKDSSVTANQKCNAVVVLSILSEPTEFLSLAAQYYPLETKVDVFADNSNEDYQVTQTFAKALVNVEISHLTFPALEKFCVGDYLKLVVGSLYSQVGRAPETSSIEFLRKQLFNARVSLQKHIIRLFFKICYVEDRINVLNEMDSANATIRLEIFLQASKLFRSTWSEETWTILKTIIEKLSEDDEPTMQYLQLSPHFDTCPPGYLSDYIHACLTVLRKSKINRLGGFMRHLEEVIDNVPERTLDDIILYKYTEQKTFDYTFCIKYLTSSSTTSVLSHRLSNMWLLLQNVIRNGWDTPTQQDSNSDDYETRRLIFAFISSVCAQNLTDSSKVWMPKQIFETLLENLKAEFETKLFKECLYIELSQLLLLESKKSGSEKLRSFGRNLALLIDSLVAKYGESIGFIYDTVELCIQNEFSIEFNNIRGIVVELIDGILETSLSRHNQMISIKLLRTENPIASSVQVLFEKIKSKLSKSDDLAVQIYWNYINH